MEAGGIEPPSEKENCRIDTCVVRCWISLLPCQRTNLVKASLLFLIPFTQTDKRNEPALTTLWTSLQARPAQNGHLLKRKRQCQKNWHFRFSGLLTWPSWKPRHAIRQIFNPVESIRPRQKALKFTQFPPYKQTIECQDLSKLFKEYLEYFD